MEQVSCCLCGSDRYQVEILGKDRMTEGETFQVVCCLCPVEGIGSGGPQALLLFPVYLFFKNHRRNYNLLHHRGEGKLLDFGCGNGRYLAELREYGWKVFGIDASEQAARFGKEGYGEVRRGNGTIMESFP